MNAILSIKPEFVKEIVSGRKRYEYRKAIFRQPVEKVYIYASAPVGRVVGEFEPVKILISEPISLYKFYRMGNKKKHQYFLITILGKCLAKSF